MMMMMAMLNPSPTGSPRRTRIKICGIRSIEMALAAVEAGADAIGLVRAEDSPRFVAPEQATAIAHALPPFIHAVTVFRNHAVEDVAASCTATIQLHGDEDEAYIARLRNFASPVRIIRGFSFDDSAIRRWNQCQGVDALLIDADRPGSGNSFAHERLAAAMATLAKPVILAGGLTPENVGDAIRTMRPYGVDVSSGVESSRGVKDAGLIREFCAAVSEADGE